MTDTTLLGAVNMALSRSMAEDDRVVILGEDVGADGGVFRATDGLIDRFGKDRVLDTPLAETTIAGLCVGLAAQGFHPVAEIQFMGFIYPCIDQLVSHASLPASHSVTDMQVPLVLRVPCGGGYGDAGQHEQALWGMLAHIPGLRVVIPSSPQRAYGLLLAAIENSDPVVFLEPKRIYRAVSEPVEDDGAPLPLDRCFVLREGGHVTLISWGAMIAETLAAADALAREGIDCEVIDVATLNPLDAETILDSVRKTGRAVIVQEAPRHAGYGAEIAATLADQALLQLLAPVRRVAGYDTVMPLPRLEKYYMPDEGRIAAAVRELMEYH